MSSPASSEGPRQKQCRDAALVLIPLFPFIPLWIQGTIVCSRKHDNQHNSFCPLLLRVLSLRPYWRATEEECGLFQWNWVSLEAVFEARSLRKLTSLLITIYVSVTKDFKSNHVLRSTNSMVWVRERTIPTEPPPLVGEVIANFCG
jgi:hypothetical protein